MPPEPAITLGQSFTKPLRAALACTNLTSHSYRDCAPFLRGAFSGFLRLVSGVASPPPIHPLPPAVSTYLYVFKVCVLQMTRRTAAHPSCSAYLEIIHLKGRIEQKLIMSLFLHVCTLAMLDLLIPPFHLTSY